MSQFSNTASKARVLVGGGTGFIGSHLGPLLESRGYIVSNLSRQPSPKNISWDDLNHKGLPGNTWAAVNLAGHNIMDFSERWTSSFKHTVEVSRVDTTRLLANSINKAHDKPNVYVVLTGVGAYEPSETAEYDEGSAITGTDFFSKLCAKWEEAAMVTPPVRLVIIRSGVVLGRTGGMIKSMYTPFKLGLGGPIGSGSQFLPWIHVDDLTSLIVYAMEHEITGVLNGVAPQVITNKEFTKQFARSMYRPAILKSPEGILNLLLNPERAMIMTKGQKVLPRRTLELGFQYQFPDIKSACKDIMEKKQL